MLSPDAMPQTMSKLEWLRERQKSIGSSDAPVIAGVSRFRTVAQLYDDKTEPITEVPEETPDLRRGRMMEGLARDLIQEEYANTVEPADQSHFFRHPDYAHSLPDGWINRERPDPPGDLGVEIKVPRPATWQKMYLHGVLPEWNVQCQHHMLVHDRREWLLAVMCPVTVTLLVETIDRDDALVESLMKREEAFWECVQSRRRPPETVTDAPLDVEEYTGAIELLSDHESKRAAHAYLEAKSLVTDSEEILDAAKAKLIQCAKGAVAFEIPKVLRCYHRQREGSKGFNKSLAFRDFPVLKDEHYVKYGKPSRPFLAFPLAKQGDTA